MTRTAHYPHPTPAYPVYALDWVSDDTLLLAGGGGATKSGIDNKLKLAKVSKDGKELKYLDELKLSNEEDAPMTLAVSRPTKQLITGINAASSSIQAGKNPQCRVFSYEDDKIAFVKGQQTIDAAWSEEFPYQKLTALSPSNHLAVGSTDNKVSLLSFPSLEQASAPMTLDSELVDLDWGNGGQWLAITTVSSLLLYRVTATEGEKSDSTSSLKLELRQTIYPPSIDISSVSFRAARFSPLASPTPTIHAVLNANRAGKRGGPRKAFVCTFGVVAGPSKAPVTEEEKAGKGKEKEKEMGKEKEKAEGAQDVEGVEGAEGDELGRWDVLVRREVAGKPVTVFDVSADGKLLSYGCSDLSISILDSKTLAPLLKILHAHSFPPTALKFNPSATLLGSASADNTIRTIVVPPSFAGLSAPMVLLLLAILVLLLALVFRR
ncbi:hypothetical protein JCM24511_08477 [Saitozyma sp. JCM 24511]|nr:hypothetical protein JCM24511_08477 [Saitozyma sp. JCM 24511]